MGKVFAGMTISIDGFVADRDGDVGRLYSDFADLEGSDYMQAIVNETGAVIMGRRTFDMAGDPDSYADTYEFQVPIFVLTHHPPERMPKQNENLMFTFVTDGVASAVSQAVAAAGEKTVTVVGGAKLVQELLLSGLADELHLDIMPVFLGEGLRFFDSPAMERVRLEKIGVRDVGARTSIRYRVARDA